VRAGWISPRVVRGRGRRFWRDGQFLSHELRASHLDVSRKPSPSCDSRISISNIWLRRAISYVVAIPAAGVAPRVHEVFPNMKNAGLTTSLDTNDDPATAGRARWTRLYPNVDILLPNEREAMKMARADDWRPQWGGSASG